MTELTEQIQPTEDTIPKSKGKLQNRITLLLIAILIPILIVFAWYDLTNQRQNLEALLLERAEATAVSGATTIGNFLSHAIESGELTKEEVFDTNYQPFWEFDPTAYPDFEGDPDSLTKYHTAYDAYTDEHWQGLIDPLLEGEELIFAIPVDVNGYLPTHNARWSSWDGSPATDRSKRIFDDPVGIQAAQNTDPTVQQIYERPGTGETLWDVSAPIYVDGEHWGAFRVGMELTQNQERVIAATWQTVVGLNLVIFFVAIFSLVVGRYVSAPIVKLTTTATRAAGGDLGQQVYIQNRQEITTLAQAFNSMILQIRDLIGNLETLITARTRDLELANEVGRTVAEIRDVDQLLSEAVKIIHDEFDLYLAQIYLVEEDQGALILRAAEGQAAERLLGQGHFLMINTASINGTAVSENRAVIVSDTTEDPRFRPNPLLPYTRSELAMPLLVADRAVGILDIQSTIPNTFTQENMPAFTAMAGHLAIALQNASLFSEREQTSAELENVLADTERQAQQLAALNDMGAKLAAASRTEDVYQIVSSQIFTLIEGDRASIALITAAGDSAEVLALEGEKGALPTGTNIPLTGTAVGLAIRENRVVQLPKESPLSTYGDSRQLAQQGLQSTLITPLSASEQVIGTLSIGSIQPYAFSEADVSLVQQAATLLATTMDNINLVERVQNLAAIVENHPDLIGIGSMDGDVIYSNPAGLALMGFPADYDITGLNAVDFYSEEDAERLMQEGIPIALETGSWTAEVQLRRTDDTTIPVEQTIAINYDKEGNASSFSITMRDIAKRQEAVESQRRLAMQLEERLLQVNAMQRAMTHKGWSAFLTSDKRLVQGFKFNNEQVNLISNQDLQQGNVPALIEPNESDNQPNSPDTAVASVEIRGETIGVIGARNPDGTPLTEGQLAILNAMSQQVADALDRARLFEEMELARQQMNTLYLGSEQVIKATSLGDVLEAVVENTSLKKLEQINLMFFDTPWLSSPPKSMTVDALWVRDEQQPKSLSDSTIELQQFPLLPYLDPEQAFVCGDVLKDERMDEDSRTFISTMLKVRSILIFPLITGGQWIGIVTAQASSPHTFPDEEIRQISSLVSQAATVSQTQRLFTVTQQRARHEQLLREVTAKVYAAPDAETILKTAVKEVNRIMGVDSFVYLDDPSSDQDPASNGHHLEKEELGTQEG